MRRTLATGRRSPKRVLRGVRRRATEFVLARRTGVRTDGILGHEELGLEDERLQPYEAAEWSTLRRALPRRSVSPDDVFVDLGSGMGRAVVMAAAYPFRRVIGVELSPRLHEIATANVEHGRFKRRCSEIELVNGDALTYELPPDASVVFLYNPFQGEVFAAAMRRLFASYDRAPRRLRIVYRNPVEHQALLSSGRVRVLRDWKGGYVYEVVPAAPASFEPGP